MGYLKKDEYIARYGESAWEKKLERTRQWRLRNPEKVKEGNTKYKKEHHDHVLEQNREWRNNNQERIKQYQAEYNQTHKTEISERGARYREKHHNERLEYNRDWKKNHVDEIKQYRKDNIKKQRGYNRSYFKKQIGRAVQLVSNYVRNDNNAGRGPCTLTRDWIIDHIFNCSCVYCGDSDWKHLGCDRIDNSLPHTPENCICACGICNIDRQLQGMSVEDFKKWRSENPRECDIKKVG